MTLSLASPEVMDTFDRLCKVFGATRGRGGGYTLQEIAGLFALSEALHAGDKEQTAELAGRLELDPDHLPALDDEADNLEVDRLLRLVGAGDLATRPEPAPHEPLPPG